MQVEHFQQDIPIDYEKLFKKEQERQIVEQFSAFGPVEDFDEEKVQREINDPKVKEVHVFKKSGISEISAQLRHEQPGLSRSKRRKLADKILKKRKSA